MEIVNKIAKSKLITLDLEGLFDETMERTVIDLKDFLFQGMILREKDFRQMLKEYNWESTSGQYVCIHCSEDAIIPNWAYMLLATYLDDHAKDYYYCSPKQLEEKILLSNIDRIDPNTYEGAKVVVKGCGNKNISSEPYLTVAKKLKGTVSSLMFGEPCSTVPVYKKKLQKN